jgi:hypothetical protein
VNPELEALSDEPGERAHRFTAFSPRLQHVLNRLPSKREVPGAAVRACNGLMNAGVFTLAALLKMSHSSLRRVNGLGPNSTADIKRVLRLFGLSLLHDIDARHRKLTERELIAELRALQGYAYGVTAEAERAASKEAERHQPYFQLGHCQASTVILARKIDELIERLEAA